MADILPFKGIRYNLEKIQLEDALAPPYDVAGQRNYNNKYSIARIDSDRGGSYYHESARLFHEFIESNILITEDQPSIYVYEQEYLFKEQLIKRCGFIAVIKLEDYSKGVIFPHEQIHAKPLEDRLNLLQACHANFNPIFSLYDGTEPDQIFQTDRKLLFTINYENVTHRLWVISDKNVIHNLVDIMKNKKIIIADGHHRYEASLKFSKDNTDAANVLMYFTSINSELTILPTHRVMNRTIPLEDIEKFFIFKKFGWADEFQDEDFGMYSNGIFYVLQNKTEPGKPNVIALHTMLDQLKIKDPINYIKDWKEAVELAKNNATAFHVDPIKPHEINDMAIAGNKFPEKSTYFFPKIPSGLVVYRF